MLRFLGIGASTKGPITRRTLQGSIPSFVVRISGGVVCILSRTPTTELSPTGRPGLEVLVTHFQPEIRAELQKLVSGDTSSAICNWCFGYGTKRCNQCLGVRYCGAKCQKLHWKNGHKQECNFAKLAQP